MVRQIPSTNIAYSALKNHCSYFTWLCDISGLSGPLARLFFETDFRWVDGIVDDENRAKDAKDLREQYAIFILADNYTASAIPTEKWKDIDLLKKSILGPACVFEVFVCLAIDADNMLNVKAEPQVKYYFNRLMENAGFDVMDEEDWDDNSEKAESYWKEILDRVLDRTYSADGKGGLFPIKTSDKTGEYNAAQRSLWEQMNDWADQEMDNSDSDFGDIFDG